MVDMILFGGLPVGPELAVIVLVLVLLFGANKIPKLAHSLGQSVSEFKKGRTTNNAESAIKADDKNEGNKI